MRRRLVARARAVNIWLMAPLLGLALFLAVFVSAAPAAQAATSSTLNFQARLLNNLGGIVPDGTYNIDFKLYTADGTTGAVGTCTGSCVWEETRTGSDRVQVIDGYFSVNLGSVTAFGGSINWDQPLWLTMNIGGTGASPSWDGEMQDGGHSIAVTALPYSFTAGQLAKTDGNGHRGTLSFDTVVNNPNILLPDASGTVCLQAASACGFESTSGTDFIRNQSTPVQTANFNIDGTGIIGTALQVPLIQTADSAAAGTTAITLRSGNETGSSFSSGAITIKSGDAGGGTNSSSGNITIDSGSSSGTGTTGSISIGATNSRSITIGNTTGATAVVINAGTGGVAVNCGTNNICKFGNDGTQHSTTIGSTNGTSSVTIQAGTGGVNIATNGVAGTVQLGNAASPVNQTINIGNNATAGSSGTLNLGNLFGTANLQGGTGVNIGTIAAAPVIKLSSTAPFTATERYTNSFTAPNTTSTVFSPATTVGSGKFAIMTIGTGAGFSVSSVFDSKGNTWNVDKSASDGTRLATIVSSQITSSITSSDTITIIYSGSNTNTVQVWVEEFAGVVSSGALDKTASGTGTLAAMSTAATSALAQSTELAIEIGRTSGVGLQYTPGTGWNSLTTTNSSDGGAGIAYKLVGSTAGVSGSMQSSSGASWAMALATYKMVPAALQVAGASTFTNVVDSATAFQVQNAGGSSILGVDTSGSQLLLGQAGTGGINGKLVFNTTNASNTSISIAAASTASSYALVLPTSGPSLGQCLQNDATTVGQLTFGPCGASGTFLNKNSIDTSGADAGSGYLYTFTNTGSAGSGGVLSLDNGNNTGTALNVKGTGSSVFQVQNGSSQRVFGVDTSAGKTVLGQSNVLDGSLLFKNSTSSNGITINSTATSSSYTLTLPTVGPAGGLCIETSTGNSSQLIFASCSNNNASIQEVQEWDVNNTNTVSVSPTTAGDEMVLTTQIPTGGVTVSSVSGGGVTTWSKAVVSAGNGTVNRVEMWVGTVTTTGSSTITVTYSSSPGSEEVAVAEFTAAGVNANTSWGIESSASQLNSTPSASVTFPNMTAVNGSELYVGYAQVQNPPASNGSSSGFNYIITSTQHNVIAYNTSLAANTAYQPAANQNSSGQSNSVAAILTAFVTSSSINNTTSLQKANFNVQAATSGTVAGVLQAASSGTADILNLRNSSSTNVLSVSSTGNVTIQPAASAAAFRVLNGSNYSVMAVDTSGNQVTLGDATHLTGKLTFADAGDSNTISLQSPTSVATSYYLKLPTNTPTAGLCLGTSPSDANQLIFASCATQVSAASISYVNKWGNSGTSVTTIADSPTNVGDLLVFFSHSTNNVTITGISGGGVTNWTKVTGNTGVTGGNVEMWRGVVTATGSGTITATYSSAAGVNDINVQEFTIGSSSGTWAVDTSGTTNGSSGTVNYPSLTPAASSELYAGYAWGANTMSAGTTTGYTYLTTSASKYLAYNTNVTGGSPQQPTASQSVSGNYNSVAALIAAYAGTSVLVNSTAVQQANFYIQAATSGSVAGILQAASSGTADILQLKDGSGNNVMAVNASSGLTLGTSNVAGGQLNFNAGGNSNTIRIFAPSAPGSSYDLTLPTTTPAAGQCLATSPSNANQLVFSSCANQVTSVAITYVNSWKGTSTTTPATLAVSPANVGDLMVLFVSFQKADSVDSGGVSGGGCSAWSKIASTGSGSGTDTTSIEMYRCQTTSTGSSSISVTWSGPAGTHELAAMEFTTGSNTGSWVVDSSNTQYNGSASTTATWPSLTPQSSKDLYVGYGAAAASFTGSVTSGFTYVSGSLSNRAGLYNTSVSTTTQPTATIGSSASLTVGALVAAYSSSSVISNSTVTQQGNFNVQAATSGSVAGVLQAYGGGTGDILELLNGTGTLVGSVGYTGNLLVKPSAASAAAFQVQTTGGVNVLSANTSTNQVVVGAGSAGESSPSLLVLDNETGTSADPTVVNGAMYYNATTHTFRCGVAGAWQNCGGLLYSNTSKSSAVSNCSSACAAFNTPASIPANYCQAGRVIKLSAAGYFSSQASASNLQFGVYYGTDASTAGNDTLIGSLSPAETVTSANNNFFRLDFNVICFSTTTMQAEGIAYIQTGTAAAGLTGAPMNSTGGTTVVTTTTKNLYIFPIWDVASASNTATITQFGVSSP